jgi:hypothetical protein
MDVKPCPKACQFDWATFEILFDMVVAHMIEENLCDVRTATLADLMAYVLAKQQANERREMEEITYGDDDNDTAPGPGLPGGHSFAYSVTKAPSSKNLF